LTGKERLTKVKNDTKMKQVVVRFDDHSYGKITEYSFAEHRGFGDFVRHATLCYIEDLEEKNARNHSFKTT